MTNRNKTGKFTIRIGVPRERDATILHLADEELLHGIATTLCAILQDGREYVVRVSPPRYGLDTNNVWEDITPALSSSPAVPIREQSVTITLRDFYDAAIGEVVHRTSIKSRGVAMRERVVLPVLRPPGIVAGVVGSIADSIERGTDLVFTPVPEGWQRVH